MGVALGLRVETQVELSLYQLVQILWEDQLALGIKLRVAVLVYRDGGGSVRKTEVCERNHLIDSDRRPLAFPHLGDLRRHFPEVKRRGVFTAIAEALRLWVAHMAARPTPNAIVPKTLDLSLGEIGVFYVQKDVLTRLAGVDSGEQRPPAAAHLPRLATNLLDLLKVGGGQLEELLSEEAAVVKLLLLDRILLLSQAVDGVPPMNDLALELAVAVSQGSTTLVVHLLSAEQIEVDDIHEEPVGLSVARRGDSGVPTICALAESAGARLFSSEVAPALVAPLVRVLNLEHGQSQKLRTVPVFCGVVSGGQGDPGGVPVLEAELIAPLRCPAVPLSAVVIALVVSPR